MSLIVITISKNQETNCALDAKIPNKSSIKKSILMNNDTLVDSKYQQISELVLQKTTRFSNFDLKYSYCQLTLSLNTASIETITKKLDFVDLMICPLNISRNGLN